MHIIERLEPVEEENIQKVFGRYDVHEAVELQQFKTGILDVFPSLLSMDDANKALSSHEFNLKHEDKYIKVITEVFMDNESSVYIYCKDIETVDLKSQCHFVNEEQLNLIDKVLGLEQDIFKTNSVELLQAFIKLSTREVLFSNLFFMVREISIVGNYDLSFPVICSSEASFYKIKCIAEKNGLFVRT